MKKILFGLLMTFGFSACTLNEEMPTDTCGDYTNLAFTGFPLSCHYSIKELKTNSAAYIISTQEKLNQYFTQHENTCTVASNPNIDFSQTYLIGLFAGQKPTSGYAIKISSIFENKCQIVINYYEKNPQAGEIVAQSLTYPSDFILIPKTNKPIYFNKTEENNDKIVIGSFYSKCTGADCQQFYQLNDYNFLKFWNVAAANYEFEQYKYAPTIKRGEYTLFLNSVPTEILNLKSQTKTYGTPDSADQGGVYFELHQGASATKIYIDNNDTPDQSAEVKVFKKAIINKILALKNN